MSTRVAERQMWVRRAGGRLFWWADGVLVALFLVGYAARYLPLAFWWAELIAIGLPYLSLAMLVLAPLAIVRRAGWPRWLHAALLVLVVVRFVPLERLTPAPDPAPDDLSLLTFNVPQWLPVETSRRTGIMRSILEASKPDIVSLQEVWGLYDHRRPTLVHGTNYVKLLVDTLGYVSPDHATDDYALAVYQLTLGRVPFEAQEYIELDKPPRDTLRAYVMRTRFRWQGREAVHYNVHLRTFGEDKPWREGGLDPMRAASWMRYARQYRRAFAVRSGEAEQILAMVEAETVPVLISGDFNSTMHNGVYQRLAQGRQDAFLVAGTGWGATYHTRLPFARIDFVLADPEWEIVSAQVIDAYMSDHRPLAVRLRWRED